MSAGASAVLVLLALNVVSLMGRPAHTSRSSHPVMSAPYPPVLQIGNPDQLSNLDVTGLLALVGIALPAGWTSTGMNSMVFGPGNELVHWSTRWTSRDKDTDGPRVIAAALTSQGWHRCAGGAERSECWQLGLHQLILTWGPGEGCPSRGPCSWASVVLFTSPPSISPVAFVPSSGR